MGAWSAYTGGFSVTMVLGSLLAVSALLNCCQLWFNFNGRSFKPGNLSDRMDISSLSSIAGKYSSGQGSSTELTELARLLERCYSNISKEKAQKMSEKELKCIKLSWKKLDRLASEQKDKFCGAERKVRVMDPMERSKSHLPREERGAFALGAATKDIVNEVCTEIDELITRIFHSLVTDIIGDEKKDQKFANAKLRLTCVKQRIFGMIAPKIPSVLKQLLSHPDIVPVIRQVLCQNAHRVIKHMTSLGAITGFLGKVSNFSEEKEVRKHVDPILDHVLKNVHSAVMDRVGKWTQQGKTAKNKCRADPKYHGDELQKFKPMCLAKVAAQVKAQKSSSNKHDSAQIAEQFNLDAICPQDLLLKIHDLEGKVFIWQVVVVILVLVLVLSWIYIAFAWITGPAKRSKKRPSVRISEKKMPRMSPRKSKRLSALDLELGEGPRASSVRVSHSIRPSHRSRKSKHSELPVPGSSRDRSRHHRKSKRKSRRSDRSNVDHLSMVRHSFRKSASPRRS